MCLTRTRRAPRFAAATSQARSGAPVLLDRPGGLRNSRQAIVPVKCFGRVVSVVLREKARLAQCSTETPGRSALRRLSGASSNCVNPYVSTTR